MYGTLDISLFISGGFWLDNIPLDKINICRANFAFKEGKLQGKGIAIDKVASTKTPLKDCVELRPFFILSFNEKIYEI